MPETVLILGAGYAGIGIAHKLPKDTRPKVEGLKVVLVSPNTHHLWNIAVVRGIVPGQLSDDKLFHPIAPGFERYPASAFEFVLGSAILVDVPKGHVQVQTAETTKNIHYTHLVVATGSSYGSRVPFTSIGTHRETCDALHDWQQKIGKASSIVIAGAGPTGVETAAEIAHIYGQTKSITIVVPGDHPLPGLSSDVGKTASNDLAKLNVKIARQARVTNVQYNVNQFTISLSSGETLKADLYLPLFGTKANSDFLTSELLDERGNLKLDSSLRATGFTNIWGAGDVGNLEPKQLIFAERQALHLAGNLHAVLTKADNGVLPLRSIVTPQVFVTIGPNKGTGQYSRFQVPGFIVSMVKGKTLFTEKAPGLVAGKNIVRSTI
ncbi:amid-like mitochondrial oxidoreductase [Fusarium sp. NRRL 25303]|nr:amid-like mitochondrial oxidoreductase [Fusarium sp. NRRL 25303]